MSVETFIPSELCTGEQMTTSLQARTCSLAVENMHCGGCMRSVEKALSALPGVEHVRANLSTKRVTLRFDPASCNEEALVHALANSGFKAAPMAVENSEGEARARDRDYLRRVAVAGFAAANIMLLSVSVWSGASGDMDAVTKEFFHRLSALIALPTVAYSGQPFLRSAIAALKGRRLNMDVPISLAVILATGMSCYQMFLGSDQVYFDAAVTLLFFLLIGRWLDQRLRTQAQGEAQNLLSLQSGLATLVAANGELSSVPVHVLMPGDVVVVAAGERIPADGLVTSGTGQIDESLITGETAAADANKGTQVYAGTLNLSSPLKISVTAADDMTLLAEIGRLMAQAEQTRGTYRRLADRAAAIYAPAVHLLGAATFAIWVLIGSGWETALTHAIAVLIITCPCALALAVPAVQIAAANRLFHNGILLKSADALERLAETDMVVFDKTGTLTLGRPVLLNGADLSDGVLAAAARLAGASFHPYAKAVAGAARERLGNVKAAADVEERPGKGLRRVTRRGEERLGSAAWCGVKKGDGASLWYRAPNGKLSAFRFSDALRPDSKEAVHLLKTNGFPVSLLSGDRREEVRKAALATGIADWKGGMEPAEKISALEDWGKARKVLMVGDGLNDAPALAQAHASISPASAAEITQRAADFLFQGDRLGVVPFAIDIAVRARRMALQNFAIALAYNAICVPLAMTGLVTPLIAAIAMSTSSILVTANALRLAKGPGIAT